MLPCLLFIVRRTADHCMNVVSILALRYNDPMARQPFFRLETTIEKLVENMFTRSFGESVNLKSIALQTARSMQANLVVDNDESRLIAPDRYILTVSEETGTQLQEQYPDLENMLKGVIAEIARSMDLQFTEPITITIDANPDLEPGKIIILSTHTELHRRSTIQMDAVHDATDPSTTTTPYLAINDNRSITLLKEVINVGRHSENDIQIDDPHVSRHHLQLRKRGDGYILFDAGSKSGTRVNHIKTNEHQLQPRDVIEIGHTQMVYLIDGVVDQASQTITLAPIQGL